MFTKDELKLLNDGLDTLLQKSMNDALFSGLIGGMLTPDKDAREKQFLAEIEKAKSEREEISDRITLLKAKLIGLKDKALVSEFVSEALDTTLEK